MENTVQLKKNDNFKYNAKSIFLTYAQCPVPKDVILEHLKSRARPVTNQLIKACIGREQHEDGNHHLHVCAWYTKPLQFRGATHMDIEYQGKTYHPNVKNKQIGNKKKALQYCSKEDPEPLQYNMDIKEETKARESHRKLISQDLILGKRTLLEAMESGDVSLHEAKKVQEGIDLYKRLKKEAKPDLPASLPNPWGRDLPVHTDRK